MIKDGKWKKRGRISGEMGLRMARVEVEARVGVY
jgi:hypothetical protein